MLNIKSSSDVSELDGNVIIESDDINLDEIFIDVYQSDNKITKKIIFSCSSNIIKYHQISS